MGVWNTETQKQTIVTDCVFDEESFGDPHVVMPEETARRAVVSSGDMAVVPSISAEAVRPVIKVASLEHSRSYLDLIEPTIFDEAMNSSQWQSWKLVIEEEWNSLQVNYTWVLTD